MEFKYLNIAFFTLVQCLVVHLNGQSEKGSHSVDSIGISNHIVYSAEELTAVKGIGKGTVAKNEGRIVIN